MLRTSGGENAIFLLHMEGTKDKRHTMIRDMDIDPLTRQIRHVDFQRVLMDQKVKVQVPIELVGTPDGVKNEAGVLDFMVREAPIECLPGNIPQSFDIDVSEFHIGDTVSFADLDLGEGIELLEDESRVIASVAHGRVEEEEEVEEGEELLEAEAEEPEVIGKGKQEEESEED
jgi:large subunit ribosomal protein L25